jgi:hypothetical protein
VNPNTYHSSVDTIFADCRSLQQRAQARARFRSLASKLTRSCAWHSFLTRLPASMHATRFAFSPRVSCYAAHDSFSASVLLHSRRSRRIQPSSVTKPNSIFPSTHRRRSQSLHRLSVRAESCFSSASAHVVRSQPACAPSLLGLRTLCGAMGFLTALSCPRLTRMSFAWPPIARPSTWVVLHPTLLSHSPAPASTSPARAEARTS